MQAIKIASVGSAQIETVPLPKLLDYYILVKVNAVAINPTDWKHIDFEVLSTKGTTVGCDFTGTVVALGSKVRKDYKPGDRISGVTHGSNASRFDSGCFGEYCIVKEGATFKVPDSMSDEKAATVGVAVTTVALAFYDNLGMPYPGSERSGNGEWVLVYGGSTATGSLAIQAAVQSGYKVVTTCSPRNFDYVKSLGAEAAFDYNDPDCSKKINEYTSDSVKLTLDCVSEGDSTKICSAAVSSSGGKIASLLPLKEDLEFRSDIEYSNVNGYTTIGEAFTMAGNDVPAMPERYRIASEFWEIAGKLFAEGKLVAHKQEVDLGGTGLKGVLSGLQTMRDGKVSGFKLVYRLNGSK